MFSRELDGYRKSEVDSFIARMKADYETRLLSEKLKALDSEKKVLDLKNEKSALEEKEKKILTAISALEKAKNFEEKGQTHFFSLIMVKLELLVKELITKFPQLRKDPTYEDIMLELTRMISDYKQKLGKDAQENKEKNDENESMQLLLDKMKEFKKQQPKEVHITTIRPDERKRAPISPYNIPDGDSGFSFEEALNPKEDLSEIMKAFDFYNETGENK